jgi:REP element-mobilizing transposase RayT
MFRSPDERSDIRDKFPGQIRAMVAYRRNFVPGGTYFFTVTLTDRRSFVLVDHVDALGESFRAARRERPFTVDAIVVLPDHLHAIFTLPAGDANFSGRWQRIKGHFSSHMIAAAAHSEPIGTGNMRSGKDGSGSTPSATTKTTRVTSTTFISIRSSTVWYRVSATGRIRRFIATSGREYWPTTGPATSAGARWTTASVGHVRSS